MKAIFIWIILLLLYQNQAVTVERISTMVRDVIDNEHVPAVLSGFMCWTTSERLHFLKVSKVPTQLNNQFKIPHHQSKDKIHKLWYFIDMRCDGAHEFLNTLDKEYFAHPYRWILLEPFEDRMEHLPFLTDSNVLVVKFNANLSHFDLIQKYKIDKNQEDFVTEMFGHWDDKMGLSDLRETRILSRRRRNLKGKVLKSTVILIKNESINELDTLKNYHIDSLGKVGYAVTNVLAEALNASVSYNYVNTWGYGNFYHPKNMTGLMGHLVRNEIDISGTVSFITTERVRHVAYLSVTLPTTVAFTFRPPPLSHVSNIYSLPFDRNVWLCAIILVCISMITIYLAYYFSESRDEQITLSDFVLCAFSIVCQIDCFLYPKRAAARFATFVFGLSLIFIYTSYTANIVALLQSTSQSIRTLSDLLNSDIELYAEDVPYSHYYFSSATEPVRKKIYETKMAPAGKPPHFVNLSYGVSMMQKGSYAIHSELGVANKHIQDTFYDHEKCGLVRMAFIQVADPLHCAPKNSPFKEIFKVNLYKIREHGIQKIERSRRYTDLPVCSSHGLNFESVRISECYAPFLILCYGMLTSLLILGFEFINKMKHCRE